MIDQTVLYGLGTKTELSKRMVGKGVAKKHDLPAEMLTELMDSVQTAIQAFASVPNMPELATKSIKEGLDKKYGPDWHVIIGEGFAYDISVQSDAYLLMCYNGNLGVLLFKS